MKKRRYLLPSILSLQLVIESLLPGRISAQGGPSQIEAKESGSQHFESTVAKRPSRLWATPRLRQMSNGQFMGHSSHRSHSSHGSHGSHSSHDSHSSHYSSNHASHYSHSSGGNFNAPSSPNKTTTTVAQMQQKQEVLGQATVREQFVYETCWLVRDQASRPSALGRVVHLQIKKGKGKWRTPTHTPGVLTDPATLAITKCPKTLVDLSAVTLWTPASPGTYLLRHVLLGINGGSNQIYPEVITVVVK